MAVWHDPSIFNVPQVGQYQYSGGDPGVTVFGMTRGCGDSRSLGLSLLAELTRVSVPPIPTYGFHSTWNLYSHLESDL